MVATGAAPLVLAFLVVLTSACGSSSASSASRAEPVVPGSAPGSAVTAPDSGPVVAGKGIGSSGTAAALKATATYRTVIGNNAAGFVAAVGRLDADLVAGDLTAAQVDELAAQSAYDGFRMLESGNSVIASTLDERATDLVPGQTFAGLHAIERVLWSGGSSADALATVGGLVAQAPVAQYLLSRDSLAPEAIGTTAVDELSWVNDVAVPGKEEVYSHLDAVDIAATVAAAHAAFTAIEPLARTVSPTLTATAASHFTGLEAQVAGLGPPGLRADATFPPAALRTLAQQVDGTAALVARLSSLLASYGSGGASS